jgi:predicted neutral ceramidase superfamily lipid hydrolase
MSDIIMALVALATLIASLGVVAYFVPEIDLILVIGFVSSLAIYDFWQSLRNKKQS